MNTIRFIIEVLMSFLKKVKGSGTIEKISMVVLAVALVAVAVFVASERFREQAQMEHEDIVVD